MHFNLFQVYFLRIKKDYHIPKKQARNKSLDNLIIIKIKIKPKIKM